MARSICARDGGVAFNGNILPEGWKLSRHVEELKKVRLATEGLGVISTSVGPAPAEGGNT